MSENHASKKIVVVGAGFSGLITSYYLLKQGSKVEIFESQGRSGGLINTLQTEHGPVETAANGILNCAELESLCKDIGVELISTKAESRNRYIFRNGRALKWPLKISETLRLIWFILRYLVFKKSVAPQLNESVSAWGARVLGSSASKYSIETAVLGIYGTEAKHLSASLVLRRLFSANKESRPKLDLGRGTVSPKNGMGELMSKLTDYLVRNGVKFNFDVEVLSPTQLPACDFLVIATSVEHATDLLLSCSDPRAEVLKAISMVPITSTTVFTKPLEKAKTVGFGVLYPQGDGNFALGTLLNNYIFENRSQNCQSDTWISPGAEIRDQILIDSILSEREKVLHQKVDLLSYQVNRWAKALPRYDLDLEKAVSDIEVVRGRIALIGNYLGEIGLKQILLRAKRLAGELAK